jgi:hypothetical protein
MTTNGQLGLGEITKVVDQESTPFHIWIFDLPLSF